MEIGSFNFKQAIKSYLYEYASTDEVFYEKLKADTFDLDKCVQYILNTVKNLEVNGLTDDEVYAMARHFVDEEGQVDIGAEIKARIIVNHTVEFTDEEKAKVKEEARKQLMEEAMKEIKSAGTKKKIKVVEEQTSLF